MGTINNVNDYVSWAPWTFWRESGTYYGFSPDTHWNKYGTNYWFSTDNWKDCHAGLDNIASVHPQNFYLDFLRREPSVSTFKERFDAADYLS